jgi:hypothetical protein
MGLKKMPAMDMVCFYGGEESKINVISATLIDRYPIAKA